MDNNNIEKLLIEAQEIIEIMLNNIENTASLKFFAGRLSLVTETLFSVLKNN